MTSVSVVLTGYKRPRYLDEQLRAVQGQTVKPHEILYWHNYSGSPPPIPIRDPHGSGIKCVEAFENFGFYSRFAFALLAAGEYVCLLDDDTIPGARWIENCLTSYSKRPGLYGTIGVILEHEGGYSPNSKVGWSSGNLNTEEVDLLGHAWFLKTSDLWVMFRESPPSWENGEDIHLSAMFQRYLGQPSLVPPHRINDLSMFGSIKPEYGNDTAASYRRSPTHWDDRDAAVVEEIRRGWKPLILR